MRLRSKVHKRKPDVRPQGVPLGFGIVRDKDGKPRVDDIDALAPEHLLIMTRADRAHLGLWDGDLVLGANGIARALPTEDGVEMVDDAVAARLVSIDGKIGQFRVRQDLAAGQQVKWRA